MPGPIMLLTYIAVWMVIIEGICASDRGGAVTTSRATCILVIVAIMVVIGVVIAYRFTW